MVRENDLPQPSPANKLAHISADISRYVELLGQGQEDGFKTADDRGGVDPIYKPWSALEAKRGVEMIIECLTERQTLQTQAGDVAATEKDRVRILTLQQILETLQDESPVKPVFLEQIKSLFSSPILEEIADTGFNYTEEKFRELAASEGGSREISEDAILRELQTIIKDPNHNIPMAIGLILRILSRESMQKSPKRELFVKAVKEICKKNNYEPAYIKVLS